MRIVSLLPSVTEIVCALGLSEHLVGVSHACDHPADVVRRVRRVTVSKLAADGLSESEIDRRVSEATAKGESLYALDEEAFVAVAPTVVFTQSLCSVCTVSAAAVNEATVRLFGPRVRMVSFEPKNLAETWDTILAIGQACDVPDRAVALVEQLKAEVDQIRSLTASVRKPRVLFLEWLVPPYSAGHWIPEMIASAGGHELLGEAGMPSVRETVERIAQAAPEVILLGPCGFDVDRAVQDALPLWQHPWWCGLPAVRNDRVYAVDANDYFSRPGPRLVGGVALLAAILHGIETGLAPKGGFRQLAPPRRADGLFDAEAGAIH